MLLNELKLITVLNYLMGAGVHVDLDSRSRLLAIMEIMLQLGPFRCCFLPSLHRIGGDDY